tara:strand:+ start:852 stop:1127 length:276 start_codon:yes stop_codon:yes gene_type:complete
MDEIQKKLEEALNQNYRLRMPGDKKYLWCHAGSFTVDDRVYSYVSEPTSKNPCIVTVRCVRHKYRHNSFTNHDFYINKDENELLSTTSTED